ncbi:MAG: helix-turn-helix domain-containing protein [Dehalococcoidia bacterium]
MNRDEILGLIVDKNQRYKWASNELHKAIALQIKALRQSRGLTQKEFANKIGTYQATISKYENESYKGHSIRILKEIAQVFDVVLIIRFTSFSEFIGWILTISANGIELVPSFPDDSISI